MKKMFFAAMAATLLLGACNKPGASKVNLKTDVDTLSYALGLVNSPTDEQIKMYLMQAGSDSAYVEQFFKGMKEGLSAGADKKQTAYQLGLQSGMQIRNQMMTGLEHQVFAGDSTRHLSIKNFLLGQNDHRKGQSALRGENGLEMQPQELQAMLMNLVNTMTAKSNEKMYGPKKKASEDFMANVAKQPGVQKLASGVCYKVLTEGKGEVPTADQMVEVEYEGRLIDGTVFDASKGQPAKFPCNQVIKGWTEALTHMPVGSEWEVYIPWDLAYGERESGPIPPYSALVFKIKLISAAKADQPAAPQLQLGQ